MLIKPIKTRIFQEGENLLQFITNHIKKLPEESVLIITSKIVALAEKRTAIITDERAKEKLIRSESQIAMRTKYVWLTVKDNMVMPSAGIDESNANGKLILLPKNSFKTANSLWLALRKKYNIKNLGVIITDSHTMPLRAGVIAMALGYAGFKGLKTYIGKTDIFGRTFRFSNVNVADSLSTAAAFTMGEGNEQQPLALITKAKIDFCEKIKKNELHIDLREDMYMPLFSTMPAQKGDAKKPALL
ncbi:MAG: coenzyme F420-0:L-glutamate ligase [Candidatus Magasanikbacteria bacterium]|nr:coenzyme F420-0:L-glutamate ligase [Candidatus Magasanikbacteria bacterium]